MCLRVLAICLASTLVVTGGQSVLPQFYSESNISLALNKLISGIETFNTRLVVRSVYDEIQKRNTVLSPFSIWNVLTSLAEGANYRTFEQLENALGFPKNDLASVRIGVNALLKDFTTNRSIVQLGSFANLFIDQNKPIYQQYKDIAARYYLTDVTTLDFSNAENAYKINALVEKQTNGKIKHLVDPAHLKNSQMIMTNVIYFKGKWTYPFNKEFTEEDTFFDENNRPIGKVNMMYQKANFPFVNSKTLKSLVVEFPYGLGERISMFIAIPHKNTSLEYMMRLLYAKTIKNVRDELEESQKRYGVDELEVYLPRFKISSDWQMNDILKGMDIYDIFYPGYADLSRLSPDNSVYLSQIIHKAVIEVTEEGVEAVAVTEADIVDRISSPVIKFNKPFFYFIVEKLTNIVLFSGIYSKPALF